MPDAAVYFDRHQRFEAAARATDRLAALACAPRLRLLDVGPHDEALNAYLDGHDLEPHGGLVGRGHGPLPHHDAAYDAALALDVLEHVASADRAFFLAELARVARLGLVLAFPVQQAAQAEAFVHSLTHSAWLAEHQAMGLPDPADIEAILTALGLAFARQPNASLASWTAMMLLMHGVERETRLAISRFFNQHFAPHENREPAYRYVYTCVKPEAFPEMDLVPGRMPPALEDTWVSSAP